MLTGSAFIRAVVGNIHKHEAGLLRSRQSIGMKLKEVAGEEVKDALHKSATQKLKTAYARHLPPFGFSSPSRMHPFVFRTPAYQV